MATAPQSRCGGLRVFVFLSVALAAKSVVDLLPDRAVETAFMFPAAKLAAMYWGVPLATSPLVFSVRGVALEVTRACSATDFFSMAVALFATVKIGACGAAPARSACRAAVAVPVAWAVAVLANAIRLVVLAVVGRVSPSSEVPAVHLAVGLSVFLPVWCALWYVLSHAEGTQRKSPGRGADVPAD